ncbi:MAG TPA: TRAP transporter small permease [Bacteroidetes bacterium]|nr:TRAP transporter small permease [Bacteroidota bacterium]
MAKVTRWINKIFSNFLIFLMASMVLVVSWQVFTRFVMHNPSSYTEELARFLLIWIGLLGAGYALHTRAHLGIDVLTYKLTGVKRQIVEIGVHSLIILFAFFVMILGGFRLVDLTFKLNQISAAMGIKMGYIYSVIPLSGLLIIFNSVDFIIKIVKKNPFGNLLN